MLVVVVPVAILRKHGDLEDDDICSVVYGQIWRDVKMKTEHDIAIATTWQF